MEPTIDGMLRELGYDPNTFEDTDIIECLYHLLIKIQKLENRIEEVADSVPLENNPQDD